MPAYNDTFELDLAEMDLIEEALRQRVKALSLGEAGATALDRERKLRNVKHLLGRLHNQKVFYRPKAGYIGG